MKALPLEQKHKDKGAKLGEFAGYNMPLYYTKPIEEHHQVRNDVGLFDISHMGQFRLTGDNVEAMLSYALPNKVKAMKDGDALYTPMCREDGGVLDDLIIYRKNAKHFRMIVNGTTLKKDHAWLEEVGHPFGIKLEDLSAGLCLLAVQGPNSLSRLGPHCGMQPASMGYYTFWETTLFGLPVFMARTGYTGEPGCELAVSVKDAPEVWDRLTGELEIPPIGLAARDTLRLEAAMPLYGHDLKETWHPLESGLGWSIHMEEGRDFIGRMALDAVKATNHAYRLVGIEVTGRGIAREGYTVMCEGNNVGEITSGVLSPTLGKSIALARIKSECAKVGFQIQVDIRGKPVDAVVVKRPFYKNDALKAIG